MLKLYQFYTKPHIAYFCWEYLKKVLKHITYKDIKMLYYIEPSAGCCDFFDLLPKDRRIGIDIVPPPKTEQTS